MILYVLAESDYLSTGSSLTLPYLYLPRNTLGNWNQALEELLPSLQTVSAVLQPFVQIKFLRQD